MNLQNVMATQPKIDACQEKIKQHGTPKKTIRALDTRGPASPAESFAPRPWGCAAHGPGWRCSATGCPPAPSHLG